MRTPILTILLLLLLALSGCELFETRDPELPSSGSSTFIPPTSVDLVLENLTNAIAEKNSENYLRCMVDTLSSDQRFEFLPTAAAAGRYASTFSEWSLQSERAWFAAMKAFSEDDAASNLALNGAFSVITADSAVYEGSYDLTFRHGVSNVAETVRGTLQFILHTDRNSTWSISRWSDIPLNDETSWSEWKGRFAN